jgi:integrase
MPRQKKPNFAQRKDRRYRCKYRGKQFYGRSPEEAAAKRDEYKRQEAAGEFIRANPTVAQYAEQWLPLHKSGVSIKCYNDYKKQLSALVDALGEDTYMRSVSVDDAAGVWKHYKGYSASTIKRAKMIFTALFDSAIENDICRRNPFRGRFAQPPKAPAGTHRALNAEEIQLIQSTEHRMQLAALIMLYAGLRRGEVLALTKKDIDLKRGEIIVNKAIRFVGNAPTIERPKTAAGTRRVPILSIIRPYLENAPQRILSTKDGGLVTSTAWKCAWNSYIAALSTQAGHPVNIRAHDLRHTYCTLLVDAGVSLKQAMQWLGHSDEKMILHIYDHVTDNRTKNSINQVESMLLRVQNGVQPESDQAIR